jgi:DNA-binding CsgD family transcriptional regulator
MTITAGAPGTSIPVGAAVPSLVRWGLSVDADLVFRTLVTMGPRTRRLLAVELGLPIQRIEPALAELVECRAAIFGQGEPATRVWAARRPDEVMVTLRARRRHLVDPQVQARMHHGVVRFLRDRATGLALPGPAPGGGGMLAAGERYLASRALSRDRLAELATAERYERLAMNTEQTWDAEAARAAAPMDRQLVEKGIQLRGIGVPPADGDQLTVSGHLVNGVSYQYRETPDVAMKLIVIDRRIALFPADPLDLERGYLEVTEPSAVQALVALFNRQWTTAVDVARGGVPPIELSERERNLIALLAAGHTDQTAAERLRISTRSVTYALRSLMDRLGVENRFQLGLTLGAHRAAAPPSLIAPSQES